MTADVEITTPTVMDLARCIAMAAAETTVTRTLEAVYLTKPVPGIQVLVRLLEYRLVGFVPSFTTMLTMVVTVDVARMTRTATNQDNRCWVAPATRCAVKKLLNVWTKEQLSQHHHPETSSPRALGLASSPISVMKTGVIVDVALMILTVTIAPRWSTVTGEVATDVTPRLRLVIGLRRLRRLICQAPPRLLLHPIRLDRFHPGTGRAESQHTGMANVVTADVVLMILTAKTSLLSFFAEMATEIRAIKAVSAYKWLPHLVPQAKGLFPRQIGLVLKGFITTNQPVAAVAEHMIQTATTLTTR